MWRLPLSSIDINDLHIQQPGFLMSKKPKSTARAGDALQRMKRNKAAAPKSANVIDSLTTMHAELDEGVELLRPHYPEATDRELRARAESLRPRRYADGRWPDLGPPSEPPQ